MKLQKVITKSQIQKELKRVAKILNSKFDNELVWLTVMKGGLNLSYELSMLIEAPMVMEYITASSYSNNKKITNKPTINFCKPIDLKGKDVVLVEDLIETGDTIREVIKHLESKNPKSITIVALMKDNKKAKLFGKHEEIYLFKQKPEGFLIGYGLDYNDAYRNLPYIAIIKKNK